MFFHKYIMNKILHNAVSAGAVPMCSGSINTFLSSGKFFMSVKWADDLLKKNSKSETHTQREWEREIVLWLLEQWFFLSVANKSVFSPSSWAPQTAPSPARLHAAFISLPMPSTYPQRVPLSLQPAQGAPQSPRLAFSITSAAGSSALAGPALVPTRVPSLRAEWFLTPALQISP